VGAAVAHARGGIRRSSARLHARRRPRLPFARRRHNARAPDPTPELLRPKRSILPPPACGKPTLEAREPGSKAPHPLSLHLRSDLRHRDGDLLKLFSAADTLTSFLDLRLAR
jgi:hypothetical protein